jgi:putative heme-binding domain-containing protein
MVHKYRGSTALCGLSFYDADNFPEAYRGGMFLGDVVNNSINFFAIERKGGTYTAKQQPDFLTSDDPWFRPADIKLGPDGALYVADFYNRIIGHYEVPLTHPGRDRTSGRIWRIVYKGTATAPRADWTKAAIKDLIDDLNHANLAARLTATHQLVERGAEAVEPVRAVLASDAPTPRAHALWVLERLGALTTGEVESALTSTDLVVKVHALRVLAERPKLTDHQALYVGQMLVGPADGVARRVAADALARHPGPIAQRALLNALAETAAADPFLRHALRIALREQFRGQAKWDGVRDQDRGAAADVALGLPEPGAADFLVAHVWWLAEHYAGRMPGFAHHVARYAPMDRAGHFVASVRQSGRVNATGAAQPVLLALLRGFQERGGTPPADVVGWGLEHCNTLLHAPKPDDLQAGIELAAALKRPELQVNVVRILINRQVPESVRVAALNGLAAFDMSRFVGTVALRLADATESITFREKVAAALAAVNAAEARTALLTTLSTAPARLASAIAAGLAGTPEGAAALLDAVATGKASPRLLQERPVQVKLAALKRKDLSDRVAKLTAGLPPADEKLAVLLRTRADAYAKAHPGADAGAKVYEKHCAACHQIAGKGAKVGPQLDGIGARGLDRLLEDVLDPNRNVDQTFRATTLTLKTGQSLTGLVLREEGEVIVLADAQGKEQRVSRAQLAEREVSPLSAMPANWSDQIPENEFHDLMAYLLAQKAK